VAIDPDTLCQEVEGDRIGGISLSEITTKYSHHNIYIYYKINKC
jgi:hypothetical protein